MLNESILQGRFAAVCDDCGWRIADQNPSGMHQRNPIAAFGLVHEMGRDEDGDVIAPRQLAQGVPEGRTRHWIDAGGGFIQYQDLRPMHHRDRQR